MADFTNIMKKLSHPKNDICVVLNPSYANTNPDLLNPMDTSKTLNASSQHRQVKYFALILSLRGQCDLGIMSFRDCNT